MASEKNTKQEPGQETLVLNLANGHTDTIEKKSATKKNLYHGKGNGAGGAVVQNEESKTLQKKLTELEARLNRNEQALEQAVDAVVQIDDLKQIIAFNKAAENMFGYKREEVLGQNVKKIVPTEHQASHDRYVDNNIRTGVNKVVGIGRDLEAMKKDGTRFWINLSMSKTQVDGDVQYMAFIKDITEERQRKLDSQGLIEAINSSSASIEFTTDGTIVTANHLFLDAMKYSLNDVRGKHHRIFCDSAYTTSPEYIRFWQELNAGKAQIGEFRRLAKDGSDVWIQASYTPVKDENGTVLKVVKIATDITQQKLKTIDYQGQIEAIAKSQATIEFGMDGIIRHANNHFLNAMGYSLNEIQGKHHSIFVESGYAASSAYKEFWAKLNRGEFLMDEYKRIGKGGKEVWIQASYNPILDLNGKPYKVVKYATDVTEQKVKALDSKGQLDAIGRSNAVIEFDMDGTVRHANENFVKAMGYSSSAEINGKHHRIFVKPEYARGSEYREFWNKLNRGEFLIGTFNRIGKNGNDVFIQASYNAILDLNGRPVKVVKYATDVTELFNLIKTIRQGSEVVAESSETLQKKVAEMKRGTTEVATAIAQMSKGAQDQAQRTDESSKLINHVMTSSNDMELKANTINKAAETGRESSNQGMKTIKVLVNNMTGIKESAVQTSKSISILTSRTEEIGRTLNVITDIASQTNLLALNAAIEAARAGDAGRGFAVVAEEIRKLAEDSRKSAIEIEKIIGDVQKDTMAATKAIELMENSVKEGGASTAQAEQIFQEIASSSEETYNASKEIKTATLSQKESISTVVKNIEQIVVVSEETAAGTQQVASSSQQMSDGMAEIGKAGDDLAAVAAELQAGVQQFRVDN